jgi:molybdenum cofactor cytidylyltransferase
MNDLDCIMLAAGSSTRMGSWKMTLPLGGSTLAERSVDTALQVCSRVVLVAGFRAEELAERFRGRSGVLVAVNHDYEQGMLSSVQAGCREARGAHFFVALADMPLVGSDTYRLLLRCATVEHPGVPVVVPQYRGKKGHPLLLAAPMRARILEAGAGCTLREVLRAVPTLVVPADDPHVLQDVDTPEDYGSLPGTKPLGEE